MGNTLHAGRLSGSSYVSSAIEQTVQACEDMSASRTGALIAFEREISLSSVISTGTVINADVNTELIKNLFYNKAPLHDGAVIIRDGRLEAAGCVLPLTQITNLSKDLGMRHRAGIGMSEQSDALVIIVSEETGAISVAIDGALKRHLTGEALGKILADGLVKPDDTQEKQTVWTYILNKVRKPFQRNGNANEQQSEKDI